MPLNSKLKTPPLCFSSMTAPAPASLRIIGGSQNPTMKRKCCLDQPSSLQRYPRTSLVSVILRMHSFNSTSGPTTASLIVKYVCSPRHRRPPALRGFPRPSPSPSQTFAGKRVWVVLEGGGKAPRTHITERAKQNNRAQSHHDKHLFRWVVVGRRRSIR